MNLRELSNGSFQDAPSEVLSPTHEVFHIVLVNRRVCRCVHGPLDFIRTFMLETM